MCNRLDTIPACDGRTDILPRHSPRYAYASRGKNYKKCHSVTRLCSKHALNIALCLKQEAQLSQRDRATLRVIEYFAKSLQVIRNDTVE